jgi:hypothetical protein
MAVKVLVTDEAVDIRICGWDKVWALSGGLTIPLDEITAARVEPILDAKRNLGWRVGGGYFPGLMATGHFTTRGKKGHRQLWCTYRDDEVLTIETKRPRPWKIVLQHPDRDRLAWWINERR